MAKCFSPAWKNLYNFLLELQLLANHIYSLHATQFLKAAILVSRRAFYRDCWFKQIHRNHKVNKQIHRNHKFKQIHRNHKVNKQHVTNNFSMLKHYLYKKIQSRVYYFATARWNFRLLSKQVKGNKTNIKTPKATTIKREVRGLKSE